jgi:hypothetical protein
MAGLSRLVEVGVKNHSVESVAQEWGSGWTILEMAMWCHSDPVVVERVKDGFGVGEGE